MKKKILYNTIFALGILFSAFVGVWAQTSSPSPKPSDDPAMIGDYKVISSVELGVRGSDVNGSENKFRSDFNYKNGFRIFNSSFLMENKQGTGKLFDTLLITTSGWSADPTGSFRLNIEKLGAYRFDSNVREVTYFNKLSNIAFGEHTANTKHHFGDFDLTILPQNETIRFRLGASFNRTRGDGGFTTRAYSDEFPVLSDVKTDSKDFRAGIDAKVVGFNLSFTQGYRKYDETTNYFINGLNLGNNPTNNSRLTTFERDYPISGKTNYSLFTAHRTFAEKLDFTGRFIYSDSESDFSLDERLTGRDNSNNTVDLDLFNISGSSKRTQGRGDIGVTYLVTDKFRISDTFTFDRFNITGGELFFESLARRNAAGTMLPTTITRTSGYRLTGYRRSTNLIEGDYQFGKNFGFNIGYRYTTRKIALQSLNTNLVTGVPTAGDEDFNNATNSVIVGATIKPVKNWTIYTDAEHGQADNVFTRLSNYDFTNFRIRNRVSFDKVAFNASLVTKDNDNPSGSSETLPTNFTATTKVRIFSTSVDYTPINELSLSGGYTYQFQNSRADILVPINSAYVNGLSRYYVRDKYFFFDVSAQPFRRVSVFASFRVDADGGQGSRTPAGNQDLLFSYPYRLLSPEVRLAFRITKNIDLNAGYQYYDFSDRYTPVQSYNAHLPYVSLRFYFGGASDRR